MSLPNSTLRMLRRSLRSSLRQPSQSQSHSHSHSRTQQPHSHLLTLHSRFLHPARSRHFSSAAASPAPATQSSPQITISPAEASDDDWEGRYRALKAQRQAAALSRWEELQADYPDIDFPSPDGAERPSRRVIAVANKLFQLTLLESFQLARLMDDTYGFSAAEAAAAAQPSGAQAAAAGPGPAVGAGAAEKKEAAPAEAKTAFSVRLDGFGAADKIKVIKEVRTATGLGLKESKELVEGAPKVVKKDLNKADCDALVAKLKEAGAKVTVE